jgi:hypothetical protein
MVVPFMFVPSGRGEIRDPYLEAYGADRGTFDLALRVGRIAHVFKWIRFRDALRQDELGHYDQGFGSWLAQAPDQTA